MEHEGKALAADELGVQDRQQVGLASVHVRVAITWLAIFPLAAIGMTTLAAVAPNWPPVLRALALTLIVVPISVYFVVPALLLLRARLRLSVARAQELRRDSRIQSVSKPRRGGQLSRPSK